MSDFLRIMSATTVRPSPSSGGDRRIELTPSDLKYLSIDQIQKGLLFRKPAQPISDLDLAQHLKASLSKTLAIFYPLGGRLAMVDHGENDTVSFSVDCNGEGALFVHAVTNGVSVSDVLDPNNHVPDDVVYSFFPMNGVLNHEGVSKPLVAVQLTELDDGFFIACSMNHSVADGTSFWHFLNTWSGISSSQNDVVSRLAPPFLGREYLNGVVDLPVRFPFCPPRARSFTPPPLKQRIFHYSKPKIAELKAKANAEMGFTAQHKISSLQSLMAHLWVSITRNRNFNGNEQVSYGVFIGLRTRMVPPLPEEYLGNAVQLGVAKSTAGELLERGLGWAALKINESIYSVTAGVEVKKLLKDWVENPSLMKIEGIPRNMLTTGSSPRFDVYGNDFGLGKPVGVRSGPGNKFDGKLTVFSGAEDGSIDFEACLSPQTLENLAHDLGFMETLG
ncbi:Transferase [Parasponia andersonii]|uniref:Transferase n=1 Tax=Parasponia andersonii TaxID=3476 RepID=A0A2P5B2J3_PARAD|nr:Transferase [Parasponia andersonii]